MIAHHVDRVIPSMRTLCGKVAGGRWGRSAVNGSFSESAAVDEVAVLVCCTASCPTCEVARPEIGWRPLLDSLYSPDVPDPVIIKADGSDITVEDSGRGSGFPIIMMSGSGSRHLFRPAVREGRDLGFRPMATTALAAARPLAAPAG